MSVFKDKTYDGMDWLSKATEPYISHINDLLENVPETTPVSLKDLAKCMSTYSGMRINSDTLLSNMLGHQNPKMPEGWMRNMDAVLRCFEIRVTDGATIDFRNNTIDGEIVINKVQNSIDEKAIVKMIVDAGRSSVYDIKRPLKREMSLRLDEVGLLLTGNNTHSFFNQTKKRLKLSSFNTMLESLIKEDGLRVRSHKLWEEVFSWITDYVNTGNTTSLINLTKVKILSERGHAIYSIEEHKNG